jgi:hypothetical protein
MEIEQFLEAKSLIVDIFLKEPTSLWQPQCNVAQLLCCPTYEHECLYSK